jgi:short-subunit dehydrogenase
MNPIVRKRALVTGASGGLGADIARELASRRFDLVLVARRESLLRELAAELTMNYGVAVDVLPTDLTAPNAPALLYEIVEANDRQIDLLVNNAGFGIHGPFADGNLDRERDMIQLDVVVPMELARLFIPGMRARGFGRILNVGSLAALQPMPTFAAYGAAKAFIRSFSRAVHYELRGSGVTCTTLSAGVTATDFFSVAGQRMGWYHRAVMMTSADVARVGVEAMLAGRPEIIPGLLNKFTAWSGRLVPTNWSTAMAHRLMTS